MRSKKVSLLRGRRVRTTLLDGAGRVIYGANSAVVSKGVVTLTYTTLTEEGEAINIVNFGGETCVSEPATPTFNGYGVEAEFCGVDFAMFEQLTGQKVILDAAGVAIGLEESTDVDLTTVNFALELWTGASSDMPPAVGSQGQWGYVLTPRLGGGVIGDLEISNAAINFTITGMATKNANVWGVGPYNVELVAGVAARLTTALEINAHRRIQAVEVGPPDIYSGSIPVLDPASPAITGLTSTNTGLSVLFAPTPAGTAPIWYDFGDGFWDYAPTGGITHVYPAAGTYTVIARRGVSSFTKTVTVTA